MTTSPPAWGPGLQAELLCGNDVALWTSPIAVPCWVGVCHPDKGSILASKEFVNLDMNTQGPYAIS